MAAVLHVSNDQLALKVQQEPDAEVECFEIRLVIVQGDQLVAKDRNYLGKWTSSDPYVKVALQPSGSANGELFLGRSKTVQRDLSPVWNAEFNATMPLEELTEDAMFEITIYDFDRFGDDDCMGIVPVHVAPMMQPHGNKNTNSTKKWYGVPVLSASRASGRIQCTLEVNKCRKTWSEVLDQRIQLQIKVAQEEMHTKIEKTKAQRAAQEQSKSRRKVGPSALVKKAKSINKKLSGKTNSKNNNEGADDGSTDEGMTNGAIGEINTNKYHHPHDEPTESTNATETSNTTATAGNHDEKPNNKGVTPPAATATAGSSTTTNNNNRQRSSGATLDGISALATGSQEVDQSNHRNRRRGSRLVDGTQGSNSRGVVNESHRNRRRRDSIAGGAVSQKQDPFHDNDKNDDDPQKESDQIQKRNRRRRVSLSTGMSSRKLHNHNNDEGEDNENVVLVEDESDRPIPSRNRRRRESLSTGTSSTRRSSSFQDNGIDDSVDDSNRNRSKTLRDGSRNQRHNTKDGTKTRRAQLTRKGSKSKSLDSSADSSERPNSNRNERRSTRKAHRASAEDNEEEYNLGDNGSVDGDNGDGDDETEATGDVDASKVRANNEKEEEVLLVKCLDSSVNEVVQMDFLNQQLCTFDQVPDALTRDPTDDALSEQKSKKETIRHSKSVIEATMPIPESVANSQEKRTDKGLPPRSKSLDETVLHPGVAMVHPHKVRKGARRGLMKIAGSTRKIAGSTRNLFKSKNKHGILLEDDEDNNDVHNDVVQGEGSESSSKEWAGLA